MQVVKWGVYRMSLIDKVWKANVNVKEKRQILQLEI